MSAGQFQIVGYQASYDTAEIHPIRVQPETLELTVTIGGTDVVNTPADLSTATSPISAVVSRGKRSRGLNARTITVEFPIPTTPPTGYLNNSPIRLAMLNPALSATPVGAVGTYLATPCRVVGTSPETAR